MSDSSWPHELQHTRLLCPSQSPGLHVHWITDVIQLSHPLLPLLLLCSIFPSIRVFFNEPAICVRWPSIGASASASVLPMNIQGWSPLRGTGLISLLSKGLWRAFSITTVQTYQFFSVLPSLWSSCNMTTGKAIALTVQTFVSKVTSLFFNILSRFIIAFLPRSNCLLISWLQSPSAVILEPSKRRICH